MAIPVEGLEDSPERLGASRAQQGHVSRRLPALGLLLSGLLALGGAARHGTHFLGGDKHGYSLILLAVAIVLGLAAMIVARKESIFETGPSRGLWHHWVILGSLLALHGFLAYRYVNSGPVRIDCYFFQRDVAETLLQGRNPFGTTHADSYNEAETRMYYGNGVVVNDRVHEGMLYLPATFLSVLPGYLLGDVRYGYVAACCFQQYLYSL